MSAQRIKSKIISMTSDYLLCFPSERERLEKLLSDLNAADDILDRKSMPGHITASGIVQEQTRILMIFHPFLNKWLQPGGHVEQGEMPLDAARREVREETGICCCAHPWHQSKAMPLDIDVHYIPDNPEKNESAHWHYDFRYLLCPDSHAEIKQEEHLTRWHEMNAIEEAHLKCLIEKLHKL